MTTDGADVLVLGGSFEEVYNGSSWVTTIYPPQNQNLYLGEQQTFNIGSTGSANYYDGLMYDFFGPKN